MQFVIVVAVSVVPLLKILWSNIAIAQPFPWKKRLFFIFVIIFEKALYWPIVFIVVAANVIVMAFSDYNVPLVPITVWTSLVTFLLTKVFLEIAAVMVIVVIIIFQFIIISIIFNVYRVCVAVSVSVVFMVIIKIMFVIFCRVIVIVIFVIAAVIALCTVVVSAHFYTLPWWSNWWDLLCGKRTKCLRNQM